MDLPFVRETHLLRASSDALKSAPTGPTMIRPRGVALPVDPPQTRNLWMMFLRLRAMRAT